MGLWRFHRWFLFRNVVADRYLVRHFVFSLARHFVWLFFLFVYVFMEWTRSQHISRSVLPKKKKQNKRSRFFRPFSFRSFHIRHRVLRRARVPRRWFLVDPCSFFCFFLLLHRIRVSIERERERKSYKTEGRRADGSHGCECGSR